MADILTRPVTRDKLARIFKNPEIVKLMENLTKDVGETLPSETGGNQEAVNAATSSAMLAMSCAASARDSATLAESMAREVQALLMTIRTQATDISNLRNEVSELRALILGT